MLNSVYKMFSKRFEDEFPDKDVAFEVSLVVPQEGARYNYLQLEISPIVVLHGGKIILTHPANPEGDDGFYQVVKAVEHIADEAVELLRTKWPEEVSEK